ncbi:MAG TPA: murein biosynthesis integral membrane protein MurJ [Aestuariivirgaceae bacterium]|jgi:putative peptidoglycan lipid II flippase
MSLLRSAATVGSLTLVSRFFGFARDVLMANVVGAGLVAQAFVIAFRFPNLFRALFAEGAFNSAFVPLFAKQMQAEGEPSAKAFAETVLAVLFSGLLVFTVAAIFAMPLVIYSIAWGFAADAEKFALSVSLTRITFPYLFFMSLTALISGVLNSLHRFTAAAFAPILLNIVLVATLVLAGSMGWGQTPRTGYALAVGVLIAGLLQLSLVWWACAKAGLALKLRRPRLDPRVKRLLWLSVPGIVSGGITQVNLLVATQIASMFDRAVSYLYYADRIYQLPLGVVGVAIGVVLLPDLSRKLRSGESVLAMSVHNRALELALFFTVPAAVAIVIIARPIIIALFEHGAFVRADSLATAAALSAFAMGLPAFVLIKVFAPGFFAREDTATPMRFALVSVLVNLSAAVSLSYVWRHVGIAAATAIAAWVNASLLGLTLWRRGHFLADAELKRRLPGMLLACFLMAAMLLLGRLLTQDSFELDASKLASGLALLFLVSSGAATYLVACHVTGAMTLRELAAMMRRSRN